MPEIARFYGMIIKMYFLKSEHNPPHIHVLYGDKLGVINLNTSQMMEGDLPNKALKLVKEWLQMYQKELLDMWVNENIHALPPLE